MDRFGITLTPFRERVETHQVSRPVGSCYASCNGRGKPFTFALEDTRYLTFQTGHISMDPTIRPVALLLLTISISLTSCDSSGPNGSGEETG